MNKAQSEFVEKWFRENLIPPEGLPVVGVVQFFEFCDALAAKANVTEGDDVLPMMRSLPSDEEIWEAAKEDEMNHLRNGIKSGFAAGARWMRDKARQ